MGYYLAKREIINIIPVFNEEGSLRELHRQITNSIKMFEEYEIVFIDDGSSDESKLIIQKMIEKDPRGS